jgi:predicted nuclease with RNAse H fold
MKVKEVRSGSELAAEIRLLFFQGVQVIHVYPTSATDILTGARLEWD